MPENLPRLFIRRRYSSAVNLRRLNHMRTLGRTPTQKRGPTHGNASRWCLNVSCSKKPVTKSAATYTPPPSATKPAFTLSADCTSINEGESARLSWTSTLKAFQSLPKSAPPPQQVPRSSLPVLLQPIRSPPAGRVGTPTPDCVSPSMLPQSAKLRKRLSRSTFSRGSARRLFRLRLRRN